MGGSPESSSRQASRQDEGSDPHTEKGAGHEAKKSKLPVWLSKELGNKRTWKTFIRCMIVVLGALALLLVNNSMLYFGQAAFFALIMSFMIPPYLAITIYALALFMVGFGMLFGWAVGCAAMAAGTRARDQALLQANYQRVQASFVPDVPTTTQLQIAIFHGEFLDPRTSAVHGAFLFVGTYFLGYLRARAPKLTVVCVFSCIILDIMTSYGTLFPSNRFTLAYQILLPAGCFMAVGMAGLLLIFPETLNHIFTDSMVKGVLHPARRILELQQDVLTTRPSDHEAWQTLADKVRGLRTTYITTSSDLNDKIAMLKLEISYGRTSANKLSEIYDKTKELAARTFGLSAFLILIDERHKSQAEMDARTNGAHPTVRYDKLQEVMNAHESEAKRGLDDLVPILESSSARLRQACLTVLNDTIEWLEWTNARRWKRGAKAVFPTSAETRQGNLHELDAALIEYRGDGHLELLEPFRDLFDEETGDFKVKEGENVPQKYMLSTRSIFRCFVFSSNLTSYAGCVRDLGALLIVVDEHTPKSKIQLPSAVVRVALKVVGSRHGGGNPLDMGIPDPDKEDDEDDDDDKPKETHLEKKQYKRDPDAERPTNALQTSGRKIAAIGHFLVSRNGQFALKFALVSVALWIPQVVKSSAWFTYTNKGIWALIMAQTALGVFAGEQIATFILRMAGTVLGLIFGMLAWYIGSGNGNGNPYGVAAATMVLSAPILYMRIIAPPAVMVVFLLAGVTMALIVGYGWVDTHQAVLGNQGSGAALAGRRALLVIIGFVAAFIIMLFPRPLSSKRMVRRSLARGIADLADLYTREVTGFILEDEDNDAAIDVAGRQLRYRAKFFAIFGKLNDVMTQMAFAKVEPSFQGAWPASKYAKLHHAEMRILSTCAILSGAYARLSPKYCKLLVRHSPFLNPNFVADSMLLLSLLHHSLQNGTPLPPTISLLERLISYEQGLPGPSHTPVSQEDASHMAVARPVLNWKALHNDQTALYATATVALSHLANAMNELQSIVISLVGETEMSGFDQIQLERGHRDVERFARS